MKVTAPTLEPNESSRHLLRYLSPHDTAISTAAPSKALETIDLAPTTLPRVSNAELCGARFLGPERTTAVAVIERSNVTGADPQKCLVLGH